MLLGKTDLLFFKQTFSLPGPSLAELLFEGARRNVFPCERPAQLNTRPPRPFWRVPACLPAVCTFSLLFVHRLAAAVADFTRVKAARWVAYERPLRGRADVVHGRKRLSRGNQLLEALIVDPGVPTALYAQLEAKW
jgi:hypothetical protein